MKLPPALSGLVLLWFWILPRAGVAANPVAEQMDICGATEDVLIRAPVGGAAAEDFKVWTFGEFGQLRNGRRIEAADFAKYGWVVEVPDELIAWYPTDAVGTGFPPGFRDALRSCRWNALGGLVVYMPRSASILTYDRRFEIQACPGDPVPVSSDGLMTTISFDGLPTEKESCRPGRGRFVEPVHRASTRPGTPPVPSP